MAFYNMKEDWVRREHYKHYMHNVRCTYSMVVQIDISDLRVALKEAGLKVYPAQIYMLAAAVNRLPAFRMGTSEDGMPGYWDVSHPSYTVFNAQTETFSSIWTAYDASFTVFYENCLQDIAKYGGGIRFEPKAEMPQNVFSVSSIPWVEFTAFNLNIYTQGSHLAPIFTIGKYVEQDGKTQMPVALQLHHAACDGYHAGQFVQLLQEMAANYKAWLFT